MPETIQTKQCSKCKEIKPLTEFNLQTRSPDGHNYWCRQCHKEYARTTKRQASMKKWSNSKHGKAVKRKYQQSQKGKEIQRISDAKRLHKIQRIAKAAVMIQVRKGNMLPAKMYKCECGKQAQEYHHYKGYKPEHWLDVVPVCIKCHKAFHSKTPRIFISSSRRAIAASICS